MNKQRRSLVLASASPRRAELLRQIGVDFTVKPAGVDERYRRGESPARYVVRLAESKAQAGAKTAAENNVVLGADTVVVLDDQILGKPRDDDDAVRMLQALSAGTHEVLTGVAVSVSSEPDLSQAVVVRTRVEFRALSDREISRYVATGEPRDKAGAYGIQGLAGAFVVSITGSYSNVVGLPLAETYRLLSERGIKTGLSN